MEQWKPVPGYEGIYEASDKGRIRTAPGKTTSNARYPVNHGYVSLALKKGRVVTSADGTAYTARTL